MLYLCKSNQNGLFAPIFSHMETKDRIKHIMEIEHMTQQEFADFLQQSPATLSSIFNGRTRPTMNVVDSIKMKIPDISLEWLLYGQGEMYITHPETVAEHHDSASDVANDQNLFLDFPNSDDLVRTNSNSPATGYQHGVRNTPSESVREEIKIFDKEPRRVTEIRVYYDDQTYETFIPAKS